MAAKPIWLRATATPIEAPMPVWPTATAAEAASTVALIALLEVAVTVTLSFAVTVELVSSATAPALIRLTAEAPAPEIAMPVWPKPAAKDAACAEAVITAWVCALIPMLPLVARAKRLTPVSPA